MSKAKHCIGISLISSQLLPLLSLKAVFFDAMLSVLRPTTKRTLSPGLAFIRVVAKQSHILLFLRAAEWTAYQGGRSRAERLRLHGLKMALDTLHALNGSTARVHERAVTHRNVVRAEATAYDILRGDDKSRLDCASLDCFNALQLQELGQSKRQNLLRSLQLSTLNQSRLVAVLTIW
jgi:hypothetical protein